eukprot:s896_g15.t1
MDRMQLPILARSWGPLVIALMAAPSSMQPAAAPATARSLTASRASGKCAIARRSKARRDEPEKNPGSDEVHGVPSPSHSISQSLKDPIQGCASAKPIEEEAIFLRFLETMNDSEGQLSNFFALLTTCSAL